MLLHIGKSLSKARCRQTSMVCSRYILGSKGWCQPRRVLLLLISFKLGNSIPSTLTKIRCLRLSSQSDKYKIKSRRLQKYKFPNSVVNWYQFGRKPFFSLNWKILKSPARAAYKNPKKCL